MDLNNYAEFGEDCRILHSLYGHNWSLKYSMLFKKFGVVKLYRNIWFICDYTLEKFHLFIPPNIVRQMVFTVFSGFGEAAKDMFLKDDMLETF